MFDEPGTMDATVNEEQRQERTAPRVNLYIAATLYGDDWSIPVKIRNLSASGARLEASACPRDGQSVSLKRGTLSADGQVAWSNGLQCGIEFLSPILVDQWVATHGPAVGQQRVDRMLARLRSGDRTGDCQGTDIPAPDVLRTRLLEELAYVTRLIDQLGDLLADDPMIIARHPTHLQSLDIASKIIGHVTTVMAAPDIGRAAAEVGMEDMRARLLRRSLG